ncbi:MAG: AbrB/MazE/SpoVT family DNA-binding domain-containing protein [Candidatus Njordarchaeales archaeon]
MELELEVRSKVGKKRVIVIPKKIAEKIGLKEGMRIKICAREDEIIIKPIVDAIELSLKGKKIARITLEELEEDSIEFQEKYIK